MTLLSNLFTDLFTIKKTIYATTSGKLTKTLSTVSTGNRGRFEAVPLLRYDQLPSHAGKIKEGSTKLYTEQNSVLEVGQVIVRESDSKEYDVIHIADFNYFNRAHHAEVTLQDRIDSVN